MNKQKSQLLSGLNQMFRIDAEGLILESDEGMFPVSDLGSGSMFEYLSFPSDLKNTIAGLSDGEVHWRRGIALTLGKRDGVFDFGFLKEAGQLYWLVSDLSHAWNGNVEERWNVTVSPAIRPQNEGPFRILLAEDNPFNQKVTLRQLARLEYQAVAVGNGQEAVDALSREHFDLVLMDLNMPVMNGYEAYQHIREKLPAPLNGIPVVALSSSGLTSHDPGFDAVLKKPAQSELLNQTIMGLLKPIAEDTDRSSEFVRLDYLHEVTQSNREMMIELMDIYLQEVPDAIEGMKACMVNHEWRALRELSHKTKSNFRYVGADRMFSLTDTIERYAASGRMVDQIPELFSQLEKMAIPTAEALQKERDAIHLLPPTEDL